MDWKKIIYITNSILKPYKFWIQYINDEISILHNGKLVDLYIKISEHYHPHYLLEYMFNNKGYSSRRDRVVTSNMSHKRVAIEIIIMIKKIYELKFDPLSYCLKIDDDLRKENNLLKEQILLYPESEFILKNVKENFNKNRNI